MCSRSITFIPIIALRLFVNAATWQVGPGQTYTLPSQVSTLVGDGDTVNIEAGVYPTDVARWQANDLVLRGVGGFAHLESNGNAWGGKAIWVIQGNNTTVEWIEFSECTVPDQNGAGIRQEGLNLTVRHCYFHDNENGILAGEVHPSAMHIEHSEFGYNGYGDGYSHNLYIGNIDSLIFRFNYSHHANVGHELKSRAWVNVIEYNRFSNEATGTASRELDLPNGGQAYLIGNVVQQGPLGENSNMVGYGLEGLSNPGPHELYAINNTLVNEKTVGTHVHTPASGLLFKAYGNILAGGGSFMAAWPSPVDTLANVRFTNIASAQFINAANYDYRIDESSPAHSAGYPAGLANSGYPLVAWYEYVHPTEGVLRCQHALLDAGAFETCTTAMDDPTSEHVFQVWPNPTNGLLSLSGAGDGPWRSIQLMDMQGRVLDVPIDRQGDRTVVDLSSLPCGPYVVAITGTNNRSYLCVVRE
jgi:hypothetical protein